MSGEEGEGDSGGFGAFWDGVGEKKAEIKKLLIEMERVDFE